MTSRSPDFDDLVGTDLDASERARLLRVHDLLVSAGPPPDLSVELDSPPTAASVHPLPRRRGMVAALAAALGVLILAIGFLAGDRADDPGTFDVVTMSGTAAAAGARASLEVFDADAAGNWPMELRVDGLEPSSSESQFELWLTRNGRLEALCGSFLAEPDGSTVVPMNAPYRLSDFDGWVVVEEGSKAPLLTT